MSKKGNKITSKYYGGQLAGNVEIQQHIARHNSTRLPENGSNSQMQRQQKWDKNIIFKTSTAICCSHKNVKQIVSNYKIFYLVIIYRLYKK